MAWYDYLFTGILILLIVPGLISLVTESFNSFLPMMMAV